MFTFMTMACFTLLIISPIAAAVAWYNWPRIMRHRSMTDPITRAETEYSLMRQSLGIEQQQTAIMRQRTEIDLLRLKTVGKGEAIYDASLGQLHQNTMLLAAPQTDATAVAAPLPELMPFVKDADNIFILGARGSGKSSFIRRLIDARARGTILDPHASPQQWGHHKVVGAGLDFGSIVAELEKIDAQRVSRYRLLGQGQTEFERETIVFDEMTEITSEIDVDSSVRKLLNCRKVFLDVIMGGHSLNAKDIGLKGSFNLVKNFNAVVRIDYNQVTKERRFWLCLNPMSHHDEFFEVANPGIYTPPVQAVPVVPRNQEAVPASVPVSSQAVPVPNAERYKGTDKQIAEYIVQGKSKTFVRENVTGRNEVIGKRYDEIYAELHPPTEQPILWFAVGQAKGGDAS